MNKKNQFLGLFLASIFGGSIALGGFMYFGNKPTVYQTVKKEQPVVLSNLSVPNTSLNFVDAASNTMPAVVHVKTYQEVQYQQQRIDPMEFYFREFFGEQQRPQQKQPNNPDPKEQPMGFGSGVIISADGYIVSNNHVIDGADKIEIVLDDKRTYIAEVIGTDPTTDLSLLKVEEAGLPYINFGSSDDIQIGEWVLAVGNPFNLTSTVTAGIVSAKARNINIIKDKRGMGIESFIQTDAAVNPGNSGGALVNLKGELIGINTAIQSQTGSFTGYAFAIPSELAKKVVSDLKEYGMVQRGMLGVRIMPITAEFAEEKGIKQLEGVYLEDVAINSAADEANLEPGDIIIEVNNNKVNSPAELQEQVARHRPGTKISIKYLRGDDTKETEVTLKNKNGNTEVISKENAEFTTALGADLVEPNKDVLKRLNLSNGLAIANLERGKLSYAGIREGFIITKVDKTIITSKSDFEKILKSKKGGVMLEGYYANGRHGFYAFEW